MSLTVKWIFWLWVSLVLAQFHDNGCFGCLEEEKNALLEFKASFYTQDSLSLPSWEDQETDCCQWESVNCDEKIGRVTKLYINNSRDSSMQDLYLNASLFLPFQELTLLNLSTNFISRLVDDDGFLRLSKLKKLQLLDLSNNTLDNSVLASIHAVTSLKTLLLGANILEGSTHIQELAALNNLEELDLSNNRLNSFITVQGLKNLSKLKVLHLNTNFFNMTTLQSLGALPSLKQLYLGDNNITGSITVEGKHHYCFSGCLLSNKFPSSVHPYSLLSFIELNTLRNLEVLDLSTNFLTQDFLQIVEFMTSLKALSLHKNRLNGTLPIQGLCKLKNLQELDLSDNDLEGTVSSCLGNLTSLWVLDLSKNRLSGNISSLLISSLRSLKFLSLSHNVFQSMASFSSFSNHSELEVFELVSNNNGLVVETENQTWVPAFQLKVFRLSNCTLNGDSIPSFLYHQHDLRVVDLSHNNLKGEFPTWLMENNTRLELLLLKNNSFTGYLHPLPLPPTNVAALDVSNNRFHGQIPSNISKLFPNLKFLNVSKNSFEGSIPSSFGDMRNLVFLDMSNNSFSGGIPKNLALGCSSLRALKLSNNDLVGQMFPEVSNMTSLENLHLDGNRLTGKIPESLSNSSSLLSLDLSYNNISGKLPGWIGNMNSLEKLLMTENHLEGSIPADFCSLDSLTDLDLSKNYLSGSIPPCFSPPSLRQVYLQGNRFTGPMTKALSECSSLVILDISNNHWTGVIPNWIHELSSLSILLMSRNQFEGKIPTQLCQLSMVTIVDLSHNNLSGPIPSCLNEIPIKIGFRSGKFRKDSYLFSSFKYLSYSYKTQFIELFQESTDRYPLRSEKTVAAFMTKNRSDFYRGNILYYMAGFDLSSNKLTGAIPPEIGKLSRIYALNLSHNHLTGPIPTTFSSLEKIESLDLSYNHLTGMIPPQLIELHNLAVFSVAYNNLSGKTPEEAQFGSFVETSYEGNPFLCVALLKKNCNQIGEGSSVTEDREENSFIDMMSFYMSFGASYITVLLGLLVILCISPDCRRKWFQLINLCITSCSTFFLHYLC
ncbi:hypothetical protein F0562_012280 [Nyssa sinensis]|uniref:Leucine-rich repeat-containing N-terminal plant-type domain-containing protein n=1 Tax=Nyssa sinensis TaxID=561372 RepID=A0A5J4ZX37_9ASTE|nr:hypothetical protein F0562_012280 [Nyssa sinensis]